MSSRLRTTRRLQARDPLGRFALLLLATLLLASPAARAGAGADSASASGQDDLLSKDMSELLKMEVTTVSKKQEPWFRTPAAVAVLTSEDIRRSGAETIPDALRLMPGVEVARIDATKWAVSARGSNGRFANKLLVLIDGRSVYTPLYSGVYWDAQDLLLDDIERIEVIRGPGAALWGSNAVNGVINIITKDSQDTQSLMSRASSGSIERMYGGVRYGGRIGGSATYRAFAVGFQRDGLASPSLARNPEGWDGQRAGFRIDWNPSLPNEMTVVGHVHSASAQQSMTVATLAVPYTASITDRIEMRGLDALGRWVHHTKRTGETTVQSSLTLTDRDEYIGHEKRATADLDFQHRMPWGDNQETIWGANYRATADDLRAIHNIVVEDGHQTDHLIGVFAQHEMRVGSLLTVTAGSKFEASRYGKPSLQPNARVGIQPDEHQTIWAACSRALRTMSRGGRSGTFRTAVFPDTLSGLPVAATYVPTGDGHNESVTAFELGYRVRPGDRLMLDVSAYHNLYRDLTLVQPGTPYLAMEGATPYLFLPLNPVNNGDATGDGVETSARFVATPHWQLRASHTWAQLEFGDSYAGGTNLTSGSLPPRHSGMVQSFLQLPRRFELDAQVQAVGALPGTKVPGYEELFLRLGWRPVPGVEASVIGENLLHRRHLEFPADVNYAASYVEREVRFTLRYVR